ncbi:hypothetical protein RI054_03g15100 [Pseudoscourfieldia marina]
MWANVHFQHPFNAGDLTPRSPVRSTHSSHSSAAPVTPPPPTTPREFASHSAMRAAIRAGTVTPGEASPIPMSGASTPRTPRARSPERGTLTLPPSIARKVTTEDIVDILRGIADHMHTHKTRTLDLFRTFDKDRSERLSVPQLCRLLQHTLKRDVTLEQARIVMVVFHQHQPSAPPLKFTAKAGASAKYEGITFQEFVTGLRAVARDFHFVSTPSPTKMTPNALRTISRLSELTGSAGDLREALRALKRAGGNVSPRLLQNREANWTRTLMEEWHFVAMAERQARFRANRVHQVLTTSRLMRIVRSWQRHASTSRTLDAAYRGLLRWRRERMTTRAFRLWHTVTVRLYRMHAVVAWSTRLARRQAEANARVLLSHWMVQAREGRAQRKLRDLSSTTEMRKALLVWESTGQGAAARVEVSFLRWLAGSRAARRARAEHSAQEVTELKVRAHTHREEHRIARLRLRHAERRARRGQAFFSWLAAARRNRVNVASSSSAAAAADWESERVELVACLKEAEEERESAIRALSSKQDTQTSQIARLGAQLKEAEARYSALAKAQEEERDAFEATIARHEAHVAESAAKLESARAERDSLSADKHRLERRARDAADESAVASAAQAAADSAHSAERSELLAQLEELRSDAVAREAKLAAAEASRDAITRRMDDIKASLSRAEATTASAREAHAAEKEDMQAHIDHLERSAEAAEAEAQRQKRALETKLEREREAMNAKLDRERDAQNTEKDAHVASLEQAHETTVTQKDALLAKLQREVEAMAAKADREKDALIAEKGAVEEKLQREVEAMAAKADRENDALIAEKGAVEEKLQREVEAMAAKADREKDALIAEKDAVEEKLQRELESMKNVLTGEKSTLEERLQSELESVRDALTKEKNEVEERLQRTEKDAADAANLAALSREELQGALQKENTVLAHRVQKLNRHRLLCGFWVWKQAAQQSRVAAERIERQEREYELEEEHDDRIDSVVAKFARVHNMRMAMIMRVSLMRLFYRWSNIVHSKRWYVESESASSTADSLRCTVQFTRVLLRSTVLERDARVAEARLIRSMLEWRMMAQYQRMHREKMFAKDKGYAAMAVQSKAVDAISLRGSFIAWRFGSMSSTSNYKLARLMSHVKA